MKQQEIKLKIQIAAFEGLDGDVSCEPDAYYDHSLSSESFDESIKDFDKEIENLNQSMQMTIKLKKFARKYRYYINDDIESLKYLIQMDLVID